MRSVLHKQLFNMVNTKWVSDLRTLPSDPNSHDFLKLEYVDVNLSNLRKLIGNLNQLRETSELLIEDVDTNVGGMTELCRVQKELEWLNGGNGENKS